MDALCSYCHNIYNWSDRSNLTILNEMRVQTAQDLNDKLQKVANPQTDEATDFEMSDIEYTESLRERVSELNLEISMYKAKTARNDPPSHPDSEVGEQPRWTEWPLVYGRENVFLIRHIVACSAD
jgi:hypothetical protein